jgi:hypothetical protein
MVISNIRLPDEQKKNGTLPVLICELPKDGSRAKRYFPDYSFDSRGPRRCKAKPSDVASIPADQAISTVDSSPSHPEKAADNSDLTPQPKKPANANVSVRNAKPMKQSAASIRGGKRGNRKARGAYSNKPIAGKHSQASIDTQTDIVGDSDSLDGAFSLGSDCSSDEAVATPKKYRTRQATGSKLSHPRDDEDEAQPVPKRAKITVKEEKPAMQMPSKPLARTASKSSVLRGYPCLIHIKDKARFNDDNLVAEIGQAGTVKPKSTAGKQPTASEPTSTAIHPKPSAKPGMDSVDTIVASPSSPMAPVSSKAAVNASTARDQMLEFTSLVLQVSQSNREVAAQIMEMANNDPSGALRLARLVIEGLQRLSQNGTN